MVAFYEGFLGLKRVMGPFPVGLTGQDTIQIFSAGPHTVLKLLAAPKLPLRDLRELSVAEGARRTRSP